MERPASRGRVAIAELRTIDPATLGDFRAVGRARLPSTVVRCLVHGAEHAMRHVGQLSVTTPIVRSGSLQPWWPVEGTRGPIRFSRTPGISVSQWAWTPIQVGSGRMAQAVSVGRRR